MLMIAREPIIGLIMQYFMLKMVILIEAIKKQSLISIRNMLKLRPFQERLEHPEKDNVLQEAVEWLND